MLGGAECITAGSIHYQDSLARRFRNIDIIDADTRPGDTLEFAGVAQHFRGHFRAASDNQTIMFADNINQFVFADAGLNDSFDAVLGI